MIRFALLLFTFFPYLAVSQERIQIASSPGWIESVAYPTASKDTMNTGGYHYLLLDRQYNLQQKAFYSRTSIKVLTEKGLEDASSITVNFDPAFQKLVFHSVIVKREDKIFNKLLTNKFEVLRREENSDRLVYDKSLDAMLNLDDIQVGDIIEYSYSIRGYNPVFNNVFARTLYFNYSVPIGKLYTRIQCQKQRTLKFETFNKASAPEKTEKGGTAFYTWDDDDVPALLTDGQTPSWFEQYAHVEISEYSSWGAVAAWASPLYNSKTASSRGIEEKLTELKQKFSSPADRINATIEFVQDEIRYLSFSDGIQGYKPHSPDQVFKQRFGDCKDKSLLLSHMLQKLGVACYPALVNTNFGKVLNVSLPSPVLFDHCITQVTFNDSVYWIDPTRTLQRGGLKSKSFIDYKNALVIKDKTTDLSSIEFSPGQSSIKVKEDYAFKVRGASATLNVETVYMGEEANAIRNFWKSNSAEEIKKIYTDFYANDFSDIKATKYVEFKDNEINNIVIAHEEYSIEDLWEYDSTERRNEASFYARVLANYLEAPKRTNRNVPYGISHPVDISQTIVIHLPSTWSVEETKVKVSSPAFLFYHEVDYVEDEIKLIHTYKSLRDYVPSSEIKDHVAKIEKAKDNLYFELSHGDVKDTVAEPKAFNTPYLMIGVMVVPLLILGMLRIYRFDPRARDYEVAYDFVSGWLILPSIGIFLSPIRTAVTLSDYFDFSTWRVLTDPGYSNYNYAIGLFNVVNYIYTLAFLACSILMIVLLIKKRTSFPTVMCIVLAVNIIYRIIETIWMYSIGAERTSTTSSAYVLLGVFISAFIWIPYFVFSDRVKGTFRERLR